MVICNGGSKSSTSPPYLVKNERSLKGRTKAYQFSTKTINCFSLFFPCRLDYRQGWDKDFRDYLKNLDKTKPVILCGDLNVAHKEIG